MYIFLKETHNIMGMAVLFLLLVIFIAVLIAVLRKKPFGKFSKIASLIGLIFIHTQVIVGMVLYFLSPLGMSNFSGESMKHGISRFYIVEHPIGMILAVVLITIGYRRAKNINRTNANRHLQILLFYGISLTIIAYLIPWFLWS